MRKATILVSFFLAGCASAPAYRAPALPLPSTFGESRHSDVVTATEATTAGPTATDDAAATLTATTPPDSIAPPASFWQTLGDSTLDRLMEEALQANRDVQAARARVSGARSERTRVALDLAPTVTFDGGYTRQRLSSAAFPVGVGSFPDQDVWSSGLDASWEIDVFGRVRHGLQAQGALVGAAEETLRDAQVAVAAELAQSYFELRGAQRQLAVARENAENQRRTLEVTRERLAAGRGTAFDTERAQAQLSRTSASIPVLEAQVASAQYRIGVLLGRPPATVTDELDGSGAIPILPETVSVADPTAVIRRRPDVVAAERQLAAERALVGAAKAEYLPRLSVGASAGFMATTLDGLGERGTFRYAVGPVISWPAFDLGRVKTQVDVAGARAEEARARYEQTALRALEEVETALARYRASRLRVERIQEAASASEHAAELARLRYSEGVADFLEVLEAERTQLEAQDQLAQARTDAATAYAALYRALGGTWVAVHGDGR